MKTPGFNKKWFFVFLFLVLYIPFLDKAFHIDDIGFIGPARAMGWNPLATPLNSTHSALPSYWIKLVSSLFGEQEVSLHLAYLPFPLLTVFCILLLYERWYPLGASLKFTVVLMYITLPAFLVNSHTIMADVPSLAFLLLFLCVYLHAEENNAPVYFYLAGIILCCAVLSAYQTLFMILPTAIYAAAKKNINIHAVAALLMPVILFAGYLVLQYKFHGIVVVSVSDFAGPGVGIAAEIKRGLVAEVVIEKIANMLATIGASLLFVYAFRLTILQQARRFLVTLLVAFVCVVLPCSLIAHRYTLMEKAGFALLVALGILIMIEVVRSSIRSEDRTNRPRDLLLLVWIISVVGYNVLVMPFGAARYLLPALLPMVFLLLDVPLTLCENQGRRTASVVVVAAAMLFGLACAYSDYAYADTYRQFSGEVTRFRAMRPASSTIWYVGRWGMQYYLDKAGCRQLSARATEPRRGDYVVLPEMPRFWAPVPELVQRMNFFASREYRSDLPVRLFNRRSNAGFYAHFWGLLPFAFSREPDEVFQIWEVVS